MREFKQPIPPSDVQKLWTAAKETESLYKLVDYLKSMPPSERRDFLECKAYVLLSLPVYADNDEDENAVLLDRLVRLERAQRATIDPLDEDEEDDDVCHPFSLVDHD